MEIDAKDVKAAVDGITDGAVSLLEKGRCLLEDWGVIQKRRRAWPWVTALLAAGMVGTFFLLRRGREGAS